DRVVDVRARRANLLERRFNPERYLRYDRDTNRSNAPAQESPPDRSTSATGAVRSSGRRMITESPAAIPAIAYIPLAPTTGSTNAAATNETVIPPWNRPSMAPRTRLRTESGERRWNRFCSATPVTPSLAPQATFRTRTSANHGESAIAMPRHAVNAVPRISQ